MAINQHTFMKYQYLQLSQPLAQEVDNLGRKQTATARKNKQKLDTINIFI